MRRLIAWTLASAVLALMAIIVISRFRRPEPTWEPGLEFNPDFDLTAEEILADIRGEAPTA